MGVGDGLRPELSQNIPEGICNLITDCWQRDQHARPTFRELVVRLEELEASLSPEEVELLEKIAQAGVARRKPPPEAEAAPKK